MTRNSERESRSSDENVKFPAVKRYVIHQPANSPQSLALVVLEVFIGPKNRGFSVLDMTHLSILYECQNIFPHLDDLVIPGENGVSLPRRKNVLESWMGVFPHPIHVGRGQGGRQLYELVFECQGAHHVESAGKEEIL